MDGDGDLDRVFHFRTQATGAIASGDTVATLTGEMLSLLAITGTDSIRTLQFLSASHRGVEGAGADYPAGEHLPENLSDDRFEVVLVELKGKE